MSSGAGGTVSTGTRQWVIDEKEKMQNLILITIILVLINDHHHLDPDHHHLDHDHRHTDHDHHHLDHDHHHLDHDEFAGRKAADCRLHLQKMSRLWQSWQPG